jgi:hypothetical protein
MVETPYTYPNLSIIENLAVYFELRKLRNKKLIEGIIEKLNLKRSSLRRCRYSKKGCQIPPPLEEGGHFYCVLTKFNEYA